VKRNDGSVGKQALKAGAPTPQGHRERERPTYTWSKTWRNIGRRGEQVSSRLQQEEDEGVEHRTELDRKKCCSVSYVAPGATTRHK